MSIRFPILDLNVKDDVGDGDGSKHSGIGFTKNDLGFSVLRERA